MRTRIRPNRVGPIITGLAVAATTLVLSPPHAAAAPPPVAECFFEKNSNGSYSIEVTPPQANLDYIMYRQVDGQGSWHWRGRSEGPIWTDNGSQPADPTDPVEYRVRSNPDSGWDPAVPTVCERRGPATASLANVSNGNGGADVTISWAAVNDADYYRLYRTNELGQTTLVADNISGTQTTDVNVSGNNSGNNYFAWHAAAVTTYNGNPKESQTSPAVSLPTVPPATMTLGQSGTTATISFPALDNVNGYNLFRVSPNGSTSWRSWNANNVAPGQTITLSDAGLTAGQTYSWKIETTNAGDSRGPKTQSGSLTVGAGGTEYQLPNDRRVDWTDTGRSVPNPPIRANVVNYGATPNNNADNDRSNVQAAIDAAANAGGGVVTIPAGSYRIAGQHLIMREGVVLRGAGAASTELFFDGPLYQGLLVGPSINSEAGWQNLTTEPAKGSTVITVPNASAFTVGGYAEIEMDNYAEAPPANNGWSQPPNPASEQWRLRTHGQLMRVTAKTGSTVTIESPLHLTFELAQNPRIRPIDLMEDVGVEGLKIRMSNSNQGRAIRAQHTAGFWMRDVETNNALASHVELFVSYRCDLEGNYLHGVSGSGNGGQGYGFNIQRHTTDCRIENNILSGFRHATLFQVGATGNVYAYNYSTNSGHPEQNRADLSFHGHFANSNLAEGNVVQQIYVADWWGRVGPWNTIARNCIRPVRSGDSGDLQISYDSDHQNLLGNVFTLTSSQVILDAGIDGTINHRNLIGGSRTTHPGTTSNTIPDSYYLSSKPGYFAAATAWPVAQSNSPAACQNQASLRGSGVANP